MAQSPARAVSAASDTRLPSSGFRRALGDELTGIHRDLLTLMHRVSLVDEEPEEEGAAAFTKLAPTLTEREVAIGLLERYSRWIDKVRPFVERSPTTPTDEFEGAFALMTSYVALRRTGSGITHAVWRELFEIESTQAVRHQLALLDSARECFAILDPRHRKTFEDLLLRFVPIDGKHYRVFAESARGDAEAEIELPFDDRDLENFVLRHCGPMRGALRGWTPSSMQPYAAFGERLFAAVFVGRVRDLYMRHAFVGTAGDVGLRLRLKLGASPRLANVPWEYLHDGSDFLALTGGVSVTRHLGADRPMRPLLVDGPLRIAVTVSAPSDQLVLDTAAEVKRLTSALAPMASAGLVQVDIARNGEVATLEAMLRAAETAGHPFHVWHFVGHGRYVAEEGATFLAFESRNGTTQMLSGFGLGTLLAAYPAVRLAVLNACEAGRSAPEDSLTSVGAALVSRGLAAVVAMQFSITDSAAICFADDFYRALADGSSLDTAVSDARRSIFFMPNESEWATPAVLLRADDGVIFDVARARHRRRPRPTD
jgi:hypothetical protein